MTVNMSMITMLRINLGAALLATCALPLCAGPAAAADGEVLINQSTVLAGGITPGDEAGFPAMINRPGRYKLRGNLSVPAGLVGIQVMASDVTIDLNGFTIRSAVPGEASGGVFVRDADRVRIANGTITGFQAFGIYLAEGEHDVVENMRILNTSGFSNGAIYAGRQTRIRNNILANNVFTIVDCSRCLIENNIITGGSFYGISVSGGVVVGNVIVGNAQHGLRGTATNFPDSGYGGNILVGNNGGNAQVHDNVFQFHPNVCEPACP